MKISQFQFVTQDLESTSHQEQIEDASRSGIDWIQLRTKVSDQASWLAMAREGVEICKRYRSRLIINDDVEIAKQVGAYGVHLGQQDMDPREAREILGDEFIIGLSVNNPVELQRVFRARVDYIGLGPYRFTRTKEDLKPVLGREGVFRVLDAMREQKINLPVVVIGGIQPEDIREVVSWGAHGVAVSSPISQAPIRSTAAESFLREFRPVEEHVRV